MSERERLVELLLESEPIKERDLDDDWGDNEISDIAEHLIKNGVIVPPVNVGQTVYVIDHTTNEPSIFRCSVTQILIESDDIYFYLDWGEVRPRLSCASIDRIGEMVFLTEEEALKALKGGVTNE